MWKRFFRPRPTTQPYITIVSGLPRSGTSMMMSMLGAGGMSLVVDDRRVPDVDNPRGYHEFESVKHLKEDASFLNDAHGKAVKIISMLLYDLPKDKQYRILFMRRDLSEILASQTIMLQRSGQNGQEDDQEMGRLFDRHLREVESWLTQQKHIDVLYVDYNEVLRDPHTGAKTVSSFLDNRLRVPDMVTVIDHVLYRNRTLGS
jgi:hypothetical protein